MKALFRCNRRKDRTESKVLGHGMTRPAVALHVATSCMRTSYLTAIVLASVQPCIWSCFQGVGIRYIYGAAKLRNGVKRHGRCYQSHYQFISDVANPG